MKELSTDAGIRSTATPKSGRVEYRIKNAPGLYLRVSSRGKKWYLRARPPGEKNPIAILMGPYGDGERAFTLKQAKAQAEQWREDVAGGGDPREETKKTKDNSYAGVRDAFLKRGQTAKGRPWKDNTKAAYASALKHPKLKKWNDVPVVQITHANVQAHINALEEDGKYTAARRHLSYLQTFFAWCRRKKQGYIPAGSALPTEGIELEKPEDNARRRVLAEDEINLIWRASKMLEYPWGAFYRTLILTGQRLNEVAQMRRDEVQEHIWTQETNKADRKHLVPLNAIVEAELEKIPEHSEYYFSTNSEVAISGFSQARKLLDREIAKILEKQEVDAQMEPWRVHDFRRTMTTHLRKLRIPRHVCSRLLNHSEQGVTAEHYDMYDMLDEKTQAMNIWGNYVESLVNPKKKGNVVSMDETAPGIAREKPRPEWLGAVPT